jgi:hypothetical protein
MGASCTGDREHHGDTHRKSDSARRDDADIPDANISSCKPKFQRMESSTTNNDAVWNG